MKPTLIISLLVLLSACGPRILVPLDTPAHMQQPYASLEIDSVTVHIENLVRRGDHLLFDIEIENNSNQCLRYHPQTMYFQAYNKKGKLVPNTSAAYRSGHNYSVPVQLSTPAYNEQKANNFMKQKISTQKAGKTFLDLLAVGLIINEIVQDSKDANKSFWTENDVDRAESRAAVNFVAQTALWASSNVMAENIASHSWEKEDIEVGYLSSGDLDPGDRVRGLVLFPKRVNTNAYHVFIPVGERMFEFVFEKPRK